MTVNINQLVSKMTLEEKAALCSGESFWTTKPLERLGIPSMFVSDGPHGLRKQGESGGDHLGLGASVPATCFPTLTNMASSWNRDLAAKVGKAIALECQAEQVGVLLGPGVNISKPLCGRNFEYYSEDPYLAGEMRGFHYREVQSEGVGTSLKHFAVNNQETYRMGVKRGCR